MSGARNRSASRSRVKPGELPPAAVKHVAKKAEGPVLIDPHFSTISLVKKYYNSFVSESPHSFAWALSRPDGAVFRSKLQVFAEDAPGAKMSIYLLGALIQEMLWQRSGSALFLSGPQLMCDAVKAAFSAGGQYEFEITAMPAVNGTQGEPFEVSVVEEAELPSAKAPAGQEKKANYYEMALKTCADKVHLSTMSPVEEQGFYALYSEFFASILEGEDTGGVEGADVADQHLPEFGDASSGWTEVSGFYKRWLEFSTRKSFDDANEWSVGDAENRKLRREIEKQNAKLRKAAIKDFNSEVRRLVDYVQKRDPRCLAHQVSKMKEDQQRSLRKREEKESRKAAEAQKKQARKEASRLAEEERWKEVKAVRQARRERGELVSEEESESDQDDSDEEEAGAGEEGEEEPDEAESGRPAAKRPERRFSPPPRAGRSPPPRAGRSPPPRAARAADGDEDAESGSGDDAGRDEKAGRDKDDEGRPGRRGRAKGAAHVEPRRDAHVKSKKEKAAEAFRKQMEELLAEEGADAQLGGASAAGAAPPDGAGGAADAEGSAPPGDDADDALQDGRRASGAAFKVTIQDDKSEDEDDGRSKREKKARQKEIEEKFVKAKAQGGEEEGDEEEEEEEEGLTHAERKRRKAAAKKELMEKADGAAPKPKPKQRRELHCRRNAHGGGKVGGGCGGR